MDKFWSQYCPRTVKSIRLATCFVLLGIFGAAAQERPWSFADNPHPTYRELTPTEREFLARTKKPDAGESACGVLLAQEYKIYQARYPDFQGTGEPETNFGNWKSHLAQSGYLISCLSVVPWQELFEIDIANSFDEFYFCGFYSRPAATAKERQAAQLIDEIVEYARTGSQSPIFFLLLANRVTNIVGLNPDIEYYFSKLTKPFLRDETPARDVSHLVPLLSQERRAFVERAADSFDYQAVLDTSRPCRPR